MCGSTQHQPPVVFIRPAKALHAPPPFSRVECAGPCVLSYLATSFPTSIFNLTIILGAGSLAIKEARVGKDGSITSHPSVKGKLDKEYNYKEERVVVADILITSRGPGTTFGFALKLVEVLVDKEKREQLEPR